MHQIRTILDYKELLVLGYKKEQLDKILKVINSYSPKAIKDKIDAMRTLGYSTENIVVMSSRFPHVFCYSVDNMQSKLIDMYNLGYKYSELLKMTLSLPAIYSYDINRIETTIKNMIGLGYSYEEVLRMTSRYPAIYSCSYDNMKEKIEFYDSIDMHALAIVDPKQLMQGVDLTYARYKFYTEQALREINMDNYKMLFISDKNFERLYGLTKKDLLEMYKYKPSSKQMQ